MPLFSVSVSGRRRTFRVGFGDRAQSRESATTNHSRARVEKEEQSVLQDVKEAVFVCTDVATFFIIKMAERH